MIDKTKAAVFVEGQYYTYNDKSGMNFKYIPVVGRVECRNNMSFLRTIEYFVKRQYEVNWELTNHRASVLYVTIPEHLKDKEEDLLTKSTTDMVDTYKQEQEANKKDIESRNVDNTTGKWINIGTLKNSLASINEKDNKGTYVNKVEVILEFFNRYNIEDARPDNPIIIASTKPRNKVVEEGRKLLYSLYEKGELRKLTEDQYKEKMDKYST